MEMAGYFRSPIIRLSLVAQDDAFDVQLFMDCTTPICRDPRIVIADNPAPVIAYGQLAQQSCGFILQPRLSPIVVEIVTQAVDRPDRIFAGKPGQFFKRCTAVIRRQELPSYGIARSLFEVQIGNEQRLARRPKERRLSRRLKIMSSKGNVCRHGECYGQCATG